MKKRSIILGIFIMGLFFSLAPVFGKSNDMNGKTEGEKYKEEGRQEQMENGMKDEMKEEAKVEPKAEMDGATNGIKGGNIRVILEAGYSTPIDNQNQMWGPGFAFAGTAFYLIHDNLYFGPRIQFDRWGPEAAGIRDLSGIPSGTVDGSAWTLQLMPTLRLTTDFDYSFFNVFGQGGVGLAIIRQDAKIGTGEAETVALDLSEERLAMNLALGATFGDIKTLCVDVIPNVSMLFLEGRTDYNLSISAGISYMFGW